MSQEGINTTIKFMTPVAGDLALARSHISDKVEMPIFFKILFSTAKHIYKTI